MVGSKLAQMADIDIGEELIRRGWRQGKMLPATSARKSWLEFSTVHEDTQEDRQQNAFLATSTIWNLQQVLLNENDWLIIVSQTCDIQRPPSLEPYVEAMTAYWTTDRSLIHAAGKNSVRHFLVTRRISSEGFVGSGLIVDATIHIQIEKESLLKCSPQESFPEDDILTPRRFSRWLGRRYNRPALPDELVVAVQKPIVKAIGKLHKTSPLHRILDGISEILLLPDDETEDDSVDMLFIRNERSNALIVTDEDEAVLLEWVDEVLQKEGKVVLGTGAVLGLKEISAYDYANAYELPTDQYSLAQDESEQ